MNKKEKTVLIAVIVVGVALLFAFIYQLILSAQQIEYYSTEGSPDESISVDYDDDNDIYDCFIKKTKEHIYISRKDVEIIVCGDPKEQLEIEGYLLEKHTCKLYALLNGGLCKLTIYLVGV